MSRYIGNYLRVPSLEPQQVSASGIWSINEQLAYQRANVWPPARDPYYNQTVLHLSGDVVGTMETNPVTQPRTFLSDASTNNFLLTPYGDVSARPFSPYGGTNYSVYFPGGTARVQFPSGNIIPASGTYTIECWIYPISLNATYGGIIASQGTTPSGDNGRTVLSITAAGILTFGIGESFPSFNSGSNVIKLNQWTHVAITRNNTVFTMYINGNRINQVTSSKTTDSGFLRLGTLWDGDGNGLVPYVGYISNFRIVYSVLTDFTNRTDSLTAISNTALLTCQSNRFIDNSTNNYLATIVGGPQVSDSSPFVSYDTTSGSGYFDGSGDYLTTPSDAAFAVGTGDFTLEAWAYWSGSRATFQLSGSSNDNFNIYFNTTSLSFYNGTTTSTISGLVINKFAWNHIVLTRTSGTAQFYLNGVAAGSSFALSTNWNSAMQFSVGRNIPVGTDYADGYISNLRFIKGSAIIPPAGGPTTPLQAVTNTQLLTLQTRAPANNQGILDTSPNSLVVTRNGNVAQGSFSPFSQSGWSNLFNNNFLTIPASNILDFGTGNFTIELFFNIRPGATSYNGWQRAALIGCNESNASTATTLSVAGSNLGANGFTWNIGGTTGSYTSAITQGIWYHVAVSKIGNAFTVFLNGEVVGSGNSSTSISNTVRYIARFSATDPTYDDYFYGYISNIRAIKGQAIYTGAFTPPTTTLRATFVGTSGTNVATSITGTVTLLTCHSNRFFEETGKTITVNSTPSVQPFSPFAPTQAYVASQLGGSAYFDSSGDSLTIPSAPALNMTGDFCMEAWAYPSAANITFAWKYVGGNVGSSEYWWTIDGTNQLSIALDGGGGEDYFRTAANTITLNAWNHCVITRVGTAVRQFINGVLQSYNTTSRTLNTTSTNFLTSAASGYISGLRIMRGSIPDIYQTTATTTGTAVFTPPTAPPVSTQNTSLLLNFTGAGIVDSTGKNVVETVDNNAVQTKIIQYGTGSMYFDGSGDYLKIQPGTFRFGTSNFTVEAWLYPTTAMAGEGDIIGFNFNSNLSSFASFRLIVANSQLKYVISTSGTSWAHTVTTGSIPVNTWTHLAFVRNGSTFTPYINGIAGTTATNSSALYEGTAGSLVGAVLVNPVSSFFNGYMKEIRVTTGLARYSGSNTSAANFTLPTAPFPLA